MNKLATFGCVLRFNSEMSSFTPFSDSKTGVTDNFNANNDDNTDEIPATHCSNQNESASDLNSTMPLNDSVIERALLQSCDNFNANNDDNTDEIPATSFKPRSFYSNSNDKKISEAQCSHQNDHDSQVDLNSTESAIDLNSTIPLNDSVIERGLVHSYELEDDENDNVIQVGSRPKRSVCVTKYFEIDENSDCELSESDSDDVFKVQEIPKSTKRCKLEINQASSKSVPENNEKKWINPKKRAGRPKGSKNKKQSIKNKK